MSWRSDSSWSLLSSMALTETHKAKTHHVSNSHYIYSNDNFLLLPFPQHSTSIYRKSSKETRGSYSFSEAPTAGLIRNLVKFCSFYLLFFKFTAGLIRMRVLFEGGSLSRIYGMWWGWWISFIPIIIFHKKIWKVPK